MGRHCARATCRSRCFIPLCHEALDIAGAAGVRTVAMFIDAQLRIDAPIAPWHRRAAYNQTPTRRSLKSLNTGMSVALVIIPVIQRLLALTLSVRARKERVQSALRMRMRRTMQCFRVKHMTYLPYPPALHPFAGVTSNSRRIPMRRREHPLKVHHHSPWWTHQRSSLKHRHRSRRKTRLQPHRMPCRRSAQQQLRQTWTSEHTTTFNV